MKKKGIIGLRQNWTVESRNDGNLNFFLVRFANGGPAERSGSFEFGVEDG